MPIRFRCAYCNQLMGIARRKAGSVVRCPKCSGQVVVPTTSDPGAPTPLPPTSASSVRPKTPQPTAPASPFDFSDIEIVPPVSVTPEDETVDVIPLNGGIPVAGVFLTTKHLLLAGVLFAVLLVAAFVLGLMLGRSEKGSRDVKAERLGVQMGLSVNGRASGGTSITLS